MAKLQDLRAMEIGKRYLVCYAIGANPSMDVVCLEKAAEMVRVRRCRDDFEEWLNANDWALLEALPDREPHPTTQSQQLAEMRRMREMVEQQADQQNELHVCNSCGEAIARVPEASWASSVAAHVVGCIRQRLRRSIAASVAGGVWSAAKPAASVEDIARDAILVADEIMKQTTTEAQP